MCKLHLQKCMCKLHVQKCSHVQTACSHVQTVIFKCMTACAKTHTLCVLSTVSGLVYYVQLSLEDNNAAALTTLHCSCHLETAVDSRFL